MAETAQTEFPDVQGTISQLKSEGYTQEQVENVLNKFPVNPEVASQLREGFATGEELEGGEAQAVAPQPDVILNRKTGVSVSLGSFDTPAIDLTNIAVENRFSVSLTTEGAKKASLILAPATEQASSSLEEQLVSGDLTSFDIARYSVQSGVQDSAMKEAEQRIVDAESPEEVQGILSETDAKLQEPVTMATLEADYVATTSSSKISLTSVTQSVKDKYNYIDLVSKAQARLWEDTGYLDLIGDVGELFTATGAISEEGNKLQVRLGALADELENAPVARRKEILQGAVDTILAQQTLLFNNSNSILMADQLQGLQDSLQDGIIGLADGRYTSDEAIDILETALNATLLVPAGVGAVKGIRGIFSFLNYKIFGKKGDFANVIPEDSVNIADGFGNTVNPNGLVFDMVRRGANPLDSKAAAVPLAKASEEADGGLKALMTKYGLTPKELIDRQIPTPSDTPDLGYANLLDNKYMVNELILTDSPHLVSGGMARARQLESLSGSSLKVIDSSTAILPNKVDDSAGTFRFLMGDGGKGGYKSYEEANEAALQGVLPNHKVVKRTDGWYVQTDVVHKFDPTKDVGGFDIKDPSGAFKRMVLDPLRNLGEDALRGLFVLKQRNRATVQDLDKRLKKALSVGSPEAALYLQKALKSGEVGEIEFRSIADLAERLNADPSSKALQTAFGKYQEVRDIMQDVWAIRNKAYRDSLVAKGMKMVDDGRNGNLGRAISRADVDDAQKGVFDIETNKLVDIDEDVAGKIRLRLSQEIDTPTGKYTDVWVTPSKIKELPPNMLNKRDGHIDRFYRDAGYLVKRTSNEVINGVATPVTKIVGIVKTKKQAAKLSKTLSKDDQAATFTTHASRENPENEQIFSDSSHIQYGYGSSHNRQRGEMLLGADAGEADTLDVFESLERTVNTVGRQLDTPVIRSMEQRFLNTFDKLLVKGKNTEFDSDITRMIKGKLEDLDTDTKNALEQYHSYIKGLKGVDQGKIFNKIDAMFSNTVFDGLVNSQKASSALQSFTSTAVIIGRPAFQVPQNLFQSIYIAMRGGRDGMKAAAQLPFLLGAMSGGEEGVKLFAKMLGVPPKTAKAVVDDIIDSGLFTAVGRADDFLSMTGGASKAPATSYAGKAGRIAVSTLKSPLKVSQALQEGSIATVNTLAYLASFNKLVKRNKMPYNAKTKARMSFEAQKMTATQNGINQFVYQNQANPMSMVFQFMQHIQKLLLDVVIDPVMVATTGKSLGKEASIFAETRKRALWTTLATLHIFGLQGLVGEKGSMGILDTIRETNPEYEENGLYDFYVNDVLGGGLVNLLLNNSVAYFGGEGRVDLSGKVGPSAFIDTAHAFYLQGMIDLFSTGVPASMEMFGATGGVIGDLISTGWDVAAIAGAPELDTTEKAFDAIKEIAGVIKGFSDAERAYIAYNIDKWPAFKTLSGTTRATNFEAIAGFFNLTPEAMQDYYTSNSFGKSSARSGEQGKAIRLSTPMIRGAMRELADLKAQGRATPLEVFKVLRKWSNNAKAIVNNRKMDSFIVDEFKKHLLDFGTPTYEQIIKKTVDNSKMGDEVPNLQILLQRATTEQMKQEIKKEIEFRKTLNFAPLEILEDE